MIGSASPSTQMNRCLETTKEVSLFDLIAASKLNRIVFKRVIAVRSHGGSKPPDGREDGGVVIGKEEC